MTKHNLPVDARGYQGGERNRKLDPQEVVQARLDHFHGRVTASQLAVRWRMSVDSVRRMLRGETYANVGEALPRAAQVAQVANMEADEGMIQRLLETQKAAEARQTPAGSPSESAERKEKAVEAFLGSGPPKSEFFEG